MAAINQSALHQAVSTAAPAASSPVYTTPAHAVGSQFVQQYYTVLHSSPRYLHRFYTDLSTMTHSDGAHDGKPGYGFTVQNQKNIHDKVTELDFEEAVTEIWSVDSQYSSNDGVIVQVTGALQCKGKARRQFVQTFFLAVQEKGYFVLNDIFRYLPPASQSARVPSSPAPLENGYAAASQPQASASQSVTPAPAAAPSPRFPANPLSASHGANMPPATPCAGPPPAAGPNTPLISAAQPTATIAPAMPTPENIPTQPVAPEVPAPTPAAAPAPEPEPEEEPEEVPQGEWPTAPEPQQELEPEIEPEPEQPVQEEEALPPQPAVPPTYAERLMANTNKKLQQNAAPGAASTRPQPTAAPTTAAPPAAATPVVPSSPAKTPAPVQNNIPTTNGNHITENGYYARDEPPGTSVFVRDLPAEVTTDKLVAAFQEFGTLRGPHPVSLKIIKGKENIAFVDFEDSSAQRAAIAGPVLIDGHKVTVMEKKPLVLKPRGRGGAMPGGRSGFRGGRGDSRGRGEGGRSAGGVPRFLERGASLGSERSDGGRGGGRRGGGRGRTGVRDSPARGSAGRGETARPAAAGPTPIAA